MLCERAHEPAAAVLMREGADNYVFAEDLTHLAPAVDSMPAGRVAQRSAGTKARDATPASQRRYRMLVDTLTVGVFVVDADGIVSHANTAAAGLLGVRPGEHLAALCARGGWFGEDGEALRPRDTPTARALATSAAQRDVTVRLRDADGRHCWFQVDAVPMLDATGMVSEVVTSLIDVTERKRTQETIRFVADVSAALNRSRGLEATLAALTQLIVPFLADWCAVDVVEPNGAIRRSATAADSADRQAAALALQQSHAPSRVAPFGVAHVLASGVSELHSTAEEVQALHRGTARDEEHLALLDQLGLVSRLIVPIAAGGQVLGALSLGVTSAERRYGRRELALAEEIAVHYQPEVDLAGGAVCGIEALVRWYHPRHGVVPPSEFVPLAEEMGLMVSIGRWVLEETCRQARLATTARPGWNAGSERQPLREEVRSPGPCPSGLWGITAHRPAAGRAQARDYGKHPDG